MLEQELDAKFAQALYLLRSGQSLAGLPVNLAAAAEIFDDDPDYLESHSFRWKLLPEIENEVTNDYKKVVKNKAVIEQKATKDDEKGAKDKNKGFDPKEFRRARRQDGITL
jgi:hypothetical protein